nr:MAG TPA: hypothetical protein [Caudoviricetes sp.]
MLSVKICNKSPKPMLGIIVFVCHYSPCSLKNISCFCHDAVKLRQAAAVLSSKVPEEVIQGIKC